jgi:hypothetical protein
MRVDDDPDYLEDRRDSMEHNQPPDYPELHQHPQLQRALRVSVITVAFDPLNDQTDA